jgi:hypothetical protein
VGGINFRCFDLMIVYNFICFSMVKSFTPVSFRRNWMLLWLKALWDSTGGGWVAGGGSFDSHVTRSFLFFLAFAFSFIFSLKFSYCNLGSCLVR